MENGHWFFLCCYFFLVANPYYYGKGGKGAPIWEIEWGMIFWHLIRFDTRRKINGSNKWSGREGRGHDGSAVRDRERAPFQDSFPLLLLHRIRDQRGMKRRRRRKPHREGERSSASFVRRAFCFYSTVQFIKTILRQHTSPKYVLGL